MCRVGGVGGVGGANRQGVERVSGVGGVGGIGGVGRPVTRSEIECSLARCTAASNGLRPITQYHPISPTSNSISHQYVRD